MILKIKRSKNPYLLWCLVIAAWVCAAQITGNQLLIVSGMMSFLGLTALSAYKGFATPVLLFFLPWSTLLKMAPGAQAFYTFALILVCVVYFLKTRFSVNIMCVILALLLFTLTLLSKVMDGNSISNSYILFVFLLLLFPVVMGELRARVDFRQLTLYFSIGIIAAALSAQQLVIYPKIARYIDVYSWNVVTRLSGYYGDANFYSAHISAALSGVLLLFLQEKGRHRNLWVILAVVLLYCGLLSASKSFILTIAVVLIFWFGKFLFMKGRMMQKIMSMIIILLLAGIVVATGIFREQWGVVVFRFGQSSTLSGLTTGRTEIWLSYGRALMEDVKLLLLGKGYTNELINGHASHNTVIQILYQFGLIGSVLLAFWEYYFVRGTLRHSGVRFRNLSVFILMIGIFMPWMGIDLVFFDEFFLMPLYMVAGVVYHQNRMVKANERIDGST